MELFQLVGKIAIDNEKANREIDQTTEKASKSEGKVSKSFKGIGSSALSVSKKVGGVGAAIGGAAFGLAEGTRDYRTEMGKLEAGFTSSGHSADAATRTYQSLYAVLGESDTSVEAANHLAKLCGDQKELDTWTRICTGVFATFGDSLPIEGLTEAANETAKVGKVTGPLADALNWAGVSEDEFNAKLEKCSNEQERQALITDTLNGLYSDAATKYREVNGDVMEANEAQGRFTDSMAKLGKIVEPVVTEVKNGIAGVIDVLAGLPGGVQKVITIIGILVVAAGPLLAGFGMVATGIGNVIGAFDKLGGAIKGIRTAFSILRAALMANPFTLIIAGIAALVAGFVYLWNHCEGFRQFWINLWENVKTVAIAVWIAITGFLSAAWGGIKAAAEAIWGGIGSFFSGLWAGVKSVAETVWNGLSAFFSSVWNGMKVAAETVWNGMASFLSAVWNGIKETILFVLDGIQSAVSNAWNGMKSIITKVMDAIKSTVSSAWTHIKSTVTTITNGIKGFISGAWSQIKSIVTTALNGIKSVVVSIWNKIKSTITGAMNGIKSVVTSVWNSIKATVANALNSIKSTVSAIWNKIKSTITSAMNGIKSVVTGAWDAIKSKTSNVLNGIKAVFSNIWNGIKKIVANAIASIKNTVSGGINNAKSIAAGALNGIKSAFSNIFGGCISVVSNAIGRIKKLFNFNWSLPKLKLPHFRINGKFSLNPPQVPHLGVEWYKKGAVLTEPTVFGLNPATGKMMVGGEAGAEAVAPIDTLMDYVRAAVREENGGLSALLEQVLAVLRSILEKELAVYLDGKEITKTVNKNLGAMY